MQIEGEKRKVDNFMYVAKTILFYLRIGRSFRSLFYVVYEINIIASAACGLLLIIKTAQNMQLFQKAEIKNVSLKFSKARSIEI